MVQKNEIKETKSAVRSNDGSTTEWSVKEKLIVLLQARLENLEELQKKAKSNKLNAVTISQERMFQMERERIEAVITEVKHITKCVIGL